MNFCLGNAIKYLWRAGLKETTTYREDLEKARWYVTREIERSTKKQEEEHVKERHGVGNQSSTVDLAIEPTSSSPTVPGPRAGDDSTWTESMPSREEAKSSVRTYDGYPPPSLRWSASGLPSSYWPHEVPRAEEPRSSTQEAGRDEAEQRAKSQRVRELNAELDRLKLLWNNVRVELVKLRNQRER